MEYKIRKAEISDSEKIWEIRNHPLLRPFFNNKEEICFTDHHQWFVQKYFKSEGNYCFVLLLDDKVIGYCRYDPERGNYIVSIAIDINFLGKGAGSFLLSESLKNIKSGLHILAEVKKENKSSLKLFQKNGFKKIGENENNIYFKYDHS